MIPRQLLTDPRLPALLLGAASAGVLGAALIFQFGFGYQPCILCIWQRWPYVAVLVFAIVTVLFRRWQGVGDGLLVASGLALLAGAGIAVYHVGVEQHLWAGTASCGSTAPIGTLSVDELRARLMATPITRCDEVQWSLFGVSMAGYNVVISLALAAYALVSARAVYTRSAS